MLIILTVLLVCKINGGTANETDKRPVLHDCVSLGVALNQSLLHGPRRDKTCLRGSVTGKGMRHAP